MTHNEFESWRQFYRLHPFDDLHRYHRPAALVSVSLGGGDVQARLDWLAPDKAVDIDASDAGYSQADLNTFKALGIKPPGPSFNQD